MPVRGAGAIFTHDGAGRRRPGDHRPRSADHRGRHGRGRLHSDRPLEPVDEGAVRNGGLRTAVLAPMFLSHADATPRVPEQERIAASGRARWPFVFRLPLRWRMTSASTMPAALRGARAPDRRARLPVLRASYRTLPVSPDASPRLVQHAGGHTKSDGYELSARSQHDPSPCARPSSTPHSAPGSPAFDESLVIRRVAIIFELPEVRGLLGVRRAGVQWVHRPSADWWRRLHRWRSRGSGWRFVLVVEQQYDDSLDVSQRLSGRDQVRSVARAEASHQLQRR